MVNAAPLSNTTNSYDIYIYIYEQINDTQLHIVSTKVAPTLILI